MTVRELKNKLNEFNDDLPVMLLDLTTDDEYDCSYVIGEKSIELVDGFHHDGKPVEIVSITFENNLNPNSIV